MLMTQTEINNLLKQINGAFESLEVRVKDLETKLEVRNWFKRGNNTKTKEKG